jgi:hypothetical protein
MLMEVVSPPLRGEKRRLLIAVVRFARKMHGLGSNYRDVYRFHIFTKTGESECPDLRVIGLERSGTVQIPVLPMARQRFGSIALLFTGAADIGLLSAAVFCDVFAVILRPLAPPLYDPQSAAHAPPDRSSRSTLAPLQSGVDGANLYRNRFRFGANEFFA